MMLGGGEGLVLAAVASPPRRPAGQREDDDGVAGGAVRGQRGADADLDVVGVRADGEHHLAAAARGALRAASAEAEHDRDELVAGRPA